MLMPTTASSAAKLYFFSIVGFLGIILPKTSSVGSHPLEASAGRRAPFTGKQLASTLAQQTHVYRLLEHAVDSQVAGLAAAPRR